MKEHRNTNRSGAVSKTKARPDLSSGADTDATCAPGSGDSSLEDISAGEEPSPDERGEASEDRTRRLNEEAEPLYH